MKIKSSLKNKSLFRVLYLVFFIVVTYVLFALFLMTHPPALNWTMIHVNQTTQGDAHLLELPNGDVFLIDVGSEKRSLVKSLKSFNISSIDKVFISHAHEDHYGGLIELLNSDIQVGDIYFNLPHQKSCDREYDWNGCRYKNLLEFRKKVESLNGPIKALSAPSVLYENELVRLTLIEALDGLNSPLGLTGINDTSLIMKLSYLNTSVLFTGDLNLKLGNYMAKNDYDLEADILKMPHHGAESLAPNHFFDRVSPGAALIPANSGLWADARCRKTRQYLEEKGISAWVNGLDGHIRVTLYPNSYYIRPQLNHWWYNLWMNLKQSLTLHQW